MKILSGFSIKKGVILIIAFSIASLEGIVAEHLQYLYAYPSAFLASFFLGASPIITERIAPLTVHGIESRKHFLFSEEFNFGYDLSGIAFFLFLIFILVSFFVIIWCNWYNYN